MLAGLLFAIHDAQDRPGRLVATLPFTGATLIEHQARQLVAAGASQLVVVTHRLTPELLGALSRIGRRVAVDAVRTAAEAAEKLHPLARVLMLADGLVTTDATVAMLAHEGGDALLVVPERDESGVERVGGHMAWAGIARLQPQRVNEATALPSDYDLQSALVRLVSQARPAHVPVGAEVLGHGHGVANGGAGLEQRGRRVLAAFFAGRRNWFDRWVVAPVARVMLPHLVGRGISVGTVAASTGAVALAGLILIGGGHGGWGTALALLGTLGLLVAATLGELRGEGRAAGGLRLASGAVPGLALLLLGWVRHGVAADGSLAIALAAVVMAALAERAMTDREPWWGSPPAYLTLALFGAVPDRIEAGLAIVAVYAAATLAAAIERLRA